jgi:Holliday junction resolvase
MHYYHRLLCEQERKKLEERGFAVTLGKMFPKDPKTPWYRYIVDIYGERGNKKVVVECGSTNKEKLSFLTGLNLKVIHVPYLLQWIPYLRLRYKKHFLWIVDEPTSLNYGEENRHTYRRLAYFIEIFMR